MRITLGTRSLILGILLAAFLMLASPISAHAATIGPLAQAQAAKDKKTVKSETCNLVTEAALLEGGGVTDVEEAAAEKQGGTCDITYTDGSATVLSWTAGKQTNTPQTSATIGSAVTSAATSQADPKAGNNAVMNGDYGSCNALHPSTWIPCILDGIGYFILTLVGFLLGIVGVLLNWVVVKTVFQFSTLIGNSQGLIISWGILRDIGNLMLLFGFVFMGIGTILDTGKLPDKRAIPKLIIFAVLLNFSIFAAEAVIDTSNVLTTVLYSQANTNPCLDSNCNINNGIAGHIMQATGLSGIYALEGATKIDGAGTGNIKVVVILGLSLFGVVGIVVLLATAIMLAFRAIVLTGLIILSPIGFAGMALKPLEKTARKWWNALIHQAFFAPILFLLIFVDLKVTEGFSSATNNNNLASALTGATGTSNMGIIMVFLLVSGGLVAALMAAKSFGAMGADIAIKTAGNFAGRATFGTGAAVMRNTVGLGSAKAGRFIRSSPIGTIPILGSTLAGIADRGANASFDVRASKLGDNFKKATKIDLGKPDKRVAKGFAGIEKDKTEALTKYAGSLKLSDKDEALKKDLETRVREDEEKEDKRIKEHKEGSEAFAEKKSKTKDAWTKREQDLSATIALLEAKVAANKDNAQVNKLNQQISAEKENAQRLRSTGSLAESFVSEDKAKDLERQRDEYVAAENELTKTRDQRTQELDAYTKTIKAIDDSITAADAKAAESETAYAKKAKETADALDNLNLKKQFAENLEFKAKIPVVGGRPDKEAAKKIKADLAKTKGEQQLDKLRAALEAKADNVPEIVAETVSAMSEENKADRA